MKHKLVNDVHSLFVCRCTLAQLKEEEKRLEERIIEAMSNSDSAVVEVPRASSTLMYSVQIKGFRNHESTSVEVCQVPFLKAQS